MNSRLHRGLIWPFLLALGTVAGWAGDLDTVGATLLRLIDPSLNGAGVPVAQAEAGYPEWEVNPGPVGQPVALFTYYASNGTASVFPNNLGSESWHANSVASQFYGVSQGVSTNVALVDNYQADYFFNVVVQGAVTVRGKVVNQSFIFGELPAAQQQLIDSAYDNKAAQNNLLFVSAAGNGGAVAAPATAYNGIGVGVIDGSSSVGPTIDNQRSKPDLTAPGGYTSFSTPLVAGAAAILIQAGARGDGGSGTTNAATDIRALKALLLNGAVKPADWTNSATAPLDLRYGAGIVNVFNSHYQLAAGKQGWIESTTNPGGGAHPPGTAAGNVPSLVGWDFDTITSSVTKDAVNHYYLAVSNATGSAFTFTATLAWNRQANKASINNLDLFLYSTATGNLVVASTSRVDNVEHLFVTGLPPGRYDLQVLKRGQANPVSTDETYALAFEAFALSLRITRAAPNVLISWPVAPAGFGLEAASALTPPLTWTPVAGAVVVSNQQNTVLITPSPAQQFFRLKRP